MCSLNSPSCHCKWWPRAEIQAQDREAQGGPGPSKVPGQHILRAGGGRGRRTLRQVHPAPRLAPGRWPCFPSSTPSLTSCLTLGPVALRRSPCCPRTALGLAPALACFPEESEREFPPPHSAMGGAASGQERVDPCHLLSGVRAESCGIWGAIMGPSCMLTPVTSCPLTAAARCLHFTGGKVRHPGCP